MSEQTDTGLGRMMAAAGLTMNAALPDVPDPAALVRRLCDQLDEAHARIRETEAAIRLVVEGALPDVPNTGMFALSVDQFSQVAATHSPNLKALREIALKVERGVCTQADVDAALAALGRIREGGA